MASSSSGTNSLEDQYARLSITEEEERAEGQSAAGDKQIKINFMSNVLSSTRRPVCGISIKGIGEDRYLFRFYHELDLQRILDNGPWSYEQNPLVLS